MQHTTARPYRSLYFCLLLLLFFLPPTNRVFAQGGLGFNVGGADAGPMVGTPAAIFWNPAAMGLMSGAHLQVDLETVVAEGVYQRSPDALSPVYPEVNASVIFPIPFIGYVSDFGQERWRFGFGAYLPFGNGGGWDATGPQRFHLIKGAEGSLFMTVSAAYKFTPRFFGGLGVSYVFSALQGEVSLDTVNTVQNLLPGGVAAPVESPLFEAHAETGLMTGHGVAMNGGVFFQPSPTVDLGFSFMLPVQVSVEGPVDVTLPDVLALGQPVLSFLGFDGRTVRAEGRIQNLRPPMIIGGVAWHQSAATTIEGMIIYSFNSLNDAMTTELAGTGLPYLDAPEGTSRRETGADNAYQLRAGTKYVLNKKLMLGGHLSFIESGIPSSHVGASNIGFNLLIPTVLAQYTYRDLSKFGISASPIFAFSRDVNDSVFSSAAPANSGIGIPTGNGSYAGFGFQLGLNYSHRF